MLFFASREYTVNKRINQTLFLTIVALLTACVDRGGEGTDVPTSPDFDFTGMMANYADAVILPTYERFGARTAALSDAQGPIASYCTSIGSENETATLTVARMEWLQNMSTWQEAEAYLVGPASANGGSIRNSIYSFFSGSPLSTCAIDQAVVLAQDPGFSINSRSFNQRGLDALEYLLFNEDLSHTCPAQIVETVDWDLRPELERKQLRCDYAIDLANDLNQSSNALTDQWQPAGSNYRSHFVDPQNLAENFQALSESLFYIELETKDTKLGIPTGIKDDCSQLTCPSAVESPFSDTALGNIRANLIGFRDGLTGVMGLGFDDIIASEGFSSVNDNFLNNIDMAIALIDSMNSSLLDQLQTIDLSGTDADCINSAANPDSVQTVPACSLHGFLKRITDSLRTEFIVIVDVELPDRAGGDND